MAKKKRKKISEQVSKKKAKASKRAIRATQRKIKLVLRNLILFAVLGGISFCLYWLSNKEFFIKLFSLLAMVFGFVGLAFLIVLLALLILKLMKK